MSKHFSASSSLISKSIGFFQWVFGLMPIMRSMVNTSLRDFLVLFSDIKIPYHEIRSFYVTSKRQSLQRLSETFNLIVPSTWISVWDLVSSSDEVADCQLAPVTTVPVKCVKKKGETPNREPWCTPWKRTHNICRYERRPNNSYFQVIIH